MPSLPGNVQHLRRTARAIMGRKPPKSANPHTRRPPAELTSLFSEV